MQGEQEEVLGLPPTIFLDRKHPEKLPAVQLSFIQNLVSPLFHACAEAGLIPGVLEDNDTPAATPLTDSSKTEGVTTPTVASDEPRSGDTGGDRAIAGSSITNEDEDGISVVVPTNKFVSVVLFNLQMNYEAWQAELPPPEVPSPAVSSQSEVPSPAVSSQSEVPSRAVSSQSEVPGTGNERAGRTEGKSSVGVSSVAEPSAKIDLPPVASKV